MSEHESFRKPPIVEAMVDIRANLPESVGLDDLAAIQDSIHERFPTREERTKWDGSIECGDEGPLMSGTTKVRNGYQFRSSDGTKIFQARLDGFTLNKLAPYSSWVELIEEAKELWDLFVRKAQPVNVTRVAARCINRIDMPLPVEDLKEYLLTAPEIAHNAPQAMSSFFMRLVLPDPATGCAAIITETNGEPSADRRFLPIIFDLDVFHEQVMIPSSPKIWEEFAKLRDLRNRIFFGSITEKTRMMFR